MSIFMISRKAEDIPESPVLGTVGPEAATEPPKEEGQVVPEAGFMTQKKIDENTIVMDGPLSKIYSEALNQAYAKESYIQEINAVNEALKKDDGVERAGSFIYVMDIDDVEDDEEFIIALETFRQATKTFTKVYFCIEHESRVTPKVADLMALAQESGVTIMHDREDVLAILADNMSESGVKPLFPFTLGDA